MRDKTLLISALGINTGDKLAIYNKYNSFQSLVDDYERGVIIKGITMHPQKMLDELKFRMDKNGISYVMTGENYYPTFFKNAEVRPLFYKGDITLLGTKKIAIVGSRSCTAYGGEAAARFSSFLAKNGFTIVSGLAVGVDAKAHIAALDADGKTIGVIAFSHEFMYPESNAKLKQAIESKGLVIGEYAPPTPPRQYNFIARNDIIAALSDGVALIEAGEKSGSLSTAKRAIALGKKLFVVTGSVFSDKMKGSNDLIMDDTSRATVSPVQILKFFSPKSSAQLSLSAAPPSKWRKLYQFIRENKPTFDEIIFSKQFELDEIKTGLFELELEGNIEKYGNVYKEKLN